MNPRLVLDVTEKKSTFISKLNALFGSPLISTTVTFIKSKFFRRNPPEMHLLGIRILLQEFGF